MSEASFPCPVCLEQPCSHGHAAAVAQELATFCIVCCVPIPEERRKRRSNTCSREHSKILRDGYRRETDKKRCRACAKPSTPEQRAAYRAWLKENPQFRPGAAAGKRGWPKGRKRTTAGTLGPVVAERAEEGVTDNIIENPPVNCEVRDLESGRLIAAGPKR